MLQRLGVYLVDRDIAAVETAAVCLCALLQYVALCCVDFYICELRTEFLADSPHPRALAVQKPLEGVDHRVAPDAIL